MSVTAFEQFLRKNNVSITAPRKKVFAVLSEAPEPLSMNQLTELCSPLDRVTIYRVIELFEKISVVHKVQIGWKYKLELSDLFHHHHHHITCRNCSKIISIEEPEGLEKTLQELAQKSGFIIERHTLELSGTCRDCKNS